MKIVKKILQEFFKIDVFGKKQLLALDLCGDETKVLTSLVPKIISQKTCLAYQIPSMTVVATGNRAYSLQGKTANNVKVSFPFWGNSIKNFEQLTDFLSQLRDEVGLKKRKNQVFLSDIWELSKIHKQYLTSLIKDTFGTDPIWVNRCLSTYTYFKTTKKINPSICILLINEFSSQLAMIVDDQVVAQKGFLIGGHDLTQQVIEQMRVQYHLAISNSWAEKIKYDVGLVLPKDQFNNQTDFLKTTVRGKNILTNLPSSIQVSSEDFLPGFSNLGTKLTEQIVDFFSTLKPEILNLILENGIVVVGKTGQMAGFRDFVEYYIKCPVALSKETSEVVVKGLFLYGQNQK